MRARWDAGFPGNEAPLLTLRASYHSFVANHGHSIDKHGTRRFASQAAFHLSNGCAAQVEGQGLRWRAKLAHVGSHLPLLARLEQKS